MRINLTSRIPRKTMVRTYMISRENSNREKSFRMHVISSCMLTGARKRIKDEWKSFSSCLCKKPPVMAPIYYSRIWNSEEMSRKMFNFSSERKEGIRISHSFWQLFYEFARHWLQYLILAKTFESPWYPYPKWSKSAKISIW